MRRTLAALLGAIGLLVGSAAPALAYEPVNVVHAETVQAGPYKLTVGFSTWPVKALQSLDFSFMPTGGIQGRTGTLSILGPGVTRERPRPLVRHPRKREVWGLDVQSLPSEGDWTFKFTVNGAEGSGTGQLTLPVLEQPGPPMALSWSISTLPLFGLVALLVIAWRRSTPEAAPAPG
ncbi:hypothetical protein N8J89_12235 [Crossiella sp. CA-258035]|uniref:hypothetical protein n=1 Tax=Crossiella sp. CA-258035 TaxID=2981138 RepID=UPI0024BD4E0A|nr:hypothetical protein [Crossiella sp. CA-258035]WHT21792.1 hypothetical protein N8J89_12235 [Crossiella sp. CA-258035]